MAIMEKEHTHVVIKMEDVFQYLEEPEQAALDGMLYKISCGRKKDGKNPVSEYYVVNKDEPYAEAVHDIILDRRRNWIPVTDRYPDVGEMKFLDKEHAFCDSGMVWVVTMDGKRSHAFLREFYLAAEVIKHENRGKPYARQWFMEDGTVSCEISDASDDGVLSWSTV